MTTVGGGEFSSPLTVSLREPSDDPTDPEQSDDSSSDPEPSDDPTDPEQSDDSSSDLEPSDDPTDPEQSDDSSSDQLAAVLTATVIMIVILSLVLL